MTHLVDGITNIIRFGDIPDVESYIPVHQLYRHASPGDIRVEMPLNDIKDSDLSLSSR